MSGRPVAATSSAQIPPVQRISILQASGNEDPTSVFYLGAHDTADNVR